MPFIRPFISNGGGLPRYARQGDGFLTFLAPAIIAADANATLTSAQVTGSGAIQFTGWTAARVITTPTAAQIIADNSEMDIGDSFILMISVVAAFNATFTAGGGVSLSGRPSILGSTAATVVITRTGAATLDWRVL